MTQHDPPPITYLAPAAMLPGGWARDVLLTVDSRGTLLEVTEGDADAAGRQLAGPVVPGMPNLHSHAFQRAMAGLAETGSGENDTFWSWRELMYRFLERLGPDEVEAIAAQLYVEMLEAGFTCVGEFHYLHHGPAGQRYQDAAEMSLRLRAAASQAGIGLTLMPVLYRCGDFGGAPPGPGQARFLLSDAEAVDLFERLSAGCGPRERVGFAFHSLRAVPPEAIVAVGRRLEADGRKPPVHIHAAEQRREVEACLEWSGARPVQWLLDNAPVDRRWCLVHATHMTEAETQRLASTGAVAGLCPTTEANLGDGLFPLSAFLDAEGVLGVGSDSHVSVSPVEELRWLEYGQRVRLERRSVAASEGGSSGGALLRAALAGGARALGHPVGTLEPGRRADLVVLDGDHPILAGRTGDALLDSWIFSGNVPVVRDVMVGGLWVVSDGRHERRDAVSARYRDAVRRMMGH